MGDTAALSEQEKQGYRLFKSYGCSACHQGVNVGGNMYQQMGLFEDYFAERGEITPADLGRWNVTGNKMDRHYFKVPSLRLASYTAPYFHDGSVAELEEAIKAMARYQLGRQIAADDVTAIAAFINSLAGQPFGRSP